MSCVFLFFSQIFLLSVPGLVLVAYIEQLSTEEREVAMVREEKRPSPSEHAHLEQMRQGKHLRKIGNVDEGVVEGSEDASNAENELTLTGLRAQLDVLLGASGLSLGCHCC